MAFGDQRKGVLAAVTRMSGFGESFRSDGGEALQSRVCVQGSVDPQLASGGVPEWTIVRYQNRVGVPCRELQVTCIVDRQRMAHGQLEGTAKDHRIRRIEHDLVKKSFDGLGGLLGNRVG